MLHGNSRNRARIAALAALEQKRLAFAREAQSLRLRRTLLVEHEGGFIGVTEGESGRLYAMSGPAPSSEKVFLLRPLTNCVARIETRIEEAEGAGGYMGFGKKGGEILRLVVYEEQGDRLILELMPDVTCFLFSSSCPVADIRQRRNNTNIVWDFLPQGRKECLCALAFWTN